MIKLRTLIYEDVDTWIKDIEHKYGLERFEIYQTSNLIRLYWIVVPKDNRNEGIGSKVMEELCKKADELKKVIVLDPSVKNSVGTTSKSRLIDFYKRFGFVVNKGKHKNFKISEMMYRLPKI